MTLEAQEAQVDAEVHAERERIRVQKAVQRARKEAKERKARKEAVRRKQGEMARLNAEMKSLGPEEDEGSIKIEIDE